MTKTELAIRVSRMYYLENLKTELIASELHISRSTVSRLVQYARSNGLVTIKIVDKENLPLQLENAIKNRYQISEVHVVPVSDELGQVEWLHRVAQFSAQYLNSRIDSNMIVGIAWGTTLSMVSKYLLPKTTHNTHFIQLNGAGNTTSTGIEYASSIITKMASNFQAKAELFPVPTFFDDPRTKVILWKERSIQRLLRLQKEASLLIYSIGAVNSGVPSQVYSGGYLDEDDFLDLRKSQVVGDIATYFFRHDGSYNDITLNARCSGPNLDLIKEKQGICIVSGLAKARGLDAALRGGLMKELIVDEPTARSLISKSFEKN